MKEYWTQILKQEECKLWVMEAVGIFKECHKKIKW